MYGLVNKAIEDLVLRRFGPEAWETIRAKSGVAVEVFVSNEAYDDSITYRLVGAASETLGVPVAALYEEFGRFWVTVTAVESYKDLLEASGNNFRDFMISLPQFHTRILLMLPYLQPPSFRCEEIEPGLLRLEYVSKRPGLNPLLEGMLLGLGEHYGESVSWQQVRHRQAGDAYDEYLIRHG